MFSVFAQQGEVVRIETGDQAIMLTAASSPVARLVDRAVVITAPRQHGLYPVEIRRTDTGRSTLLNVWVSVPKSAMQGEYLNGYRIGSYPPPRKNRPNYEPPEGFVEVTADNVDTAVSTHFTLRQFLCKQEADYPKYVVIQEGLLVMLEGLLAEVNAAGFEIESFGVISGFRTPFYNKKIGNVPYSRHVYGDAFDFYIDENRDGRMDDIDGDGMRNQRDIIRFFVLVDRFMRRPENQHLLGGIGKYNKTSRHGGFIHVDTRGYQARW